MLCRDWYIQEQLDFSEAEILSVLQWPLSFIFHMFYFHSLNAYYSEFMEEHALTSFKCWTMVNWVLGSYLWMFFFNVLIPITQNSWLLMLWLPLGIKLWSINLNSFLLNTLMYHYSEFMPTCSDSYELQVIETFLNVSLFRWSIYKPQFYKKSYLLSLSFSLTP